MSKGYAIVTLVLAACFFLPAAAGFFSDPAERAKIQKRALASWPEAALLVHDPKTYFSKANDYFADNAAPIIEATRAYRRFLAEALRSSPSPDIALGDGPFVFFDIHKNAGGDSVFSALCPEILDPQAAARLKEAALALYDAFGAGKRRVLAVVIPTKPSLYGDRLPRSVSEKDRELCARHATGDNALLSLDVSRPGGILVYPYAEMAARRDEPHFYPPESFHNGAESARVVAGRVFQAAGIEPVPGYLNAVKALDEEASDLSSILGYDKRIKDWFYDDYTPFGLSQAFKEPQEVGRIYKKAYDWRTFTVKNPMSRRKALVLGDSFAAKNALALAPGYESLLQININGIEPDELLALKAYLDRFHFDDVFFIMSDDNAFRLIPHIARTLGG